MNRYFIETDGNTGVLSAKNIIEALELFEKYFGPLGDSVSVKTVYNQRGE